MPNKKNIDEVGIKPDIEVELDNNRYEISDKDIDLQVYTAIKHLS